MKQGKFNSLTAMLIAAATVFSTVGCTRVSSSTDDLTVDMTRSANVECVDGDESFDDIYTDFSAELFRRSFKNENTLISPLSVMLALGISANGSAGETAEEYTRLFGGADADDMNKYLYSYVESICGEEEAKLASANSLWLNGEMNYEVKSDFLQNVIDYYSADVFKSSFGESTVNEMNSWCSEHTDGMVENAVSGLPEDAAALIVNAVCFSAPWVDNYSDSQISDGIFTSQSGDERAVKMLSSLEGGYIESPLATGFKKYYLGNRYAFVALLPNEGVSISTFADSLNGDEIRSLLDSESEVHSVRVSMPEFAYGSKVDMTEALAEMGLEKSFSPSADYSGITSDMPIHIGGIEHATRIELTRNGTSCAAVTVEQLMGASMPDKSVVLDRPFVYMIVDCENSLPVMIGAVTDITE